MNEEIMETEVTTEIMGEITTELTTELSTTLDSPSETTTTTTEVVVEDVGEGYPTDEENVVHELFATLGVNLDYVPKNPYQCFAMGCSLLCALFTLIWFCKFMLALSRDFFK